MIDIGKCRRALAVAAQEYAAEIRYTRNNDTASMKKLVRASLDYAEAHRELNSFRAPPRRKKKP